MELPLYDPEMILGYTVRLYRRASAVRSGAIAVGIILGASFGSVPLSPFGSAWPIPAGFGFATLLAGALVGGVVGWVVGDARAFGYRLQAQTALCQLQAERNSSMLARALEARRPAPAQAPAAPRAPAPAAAAPAQPVPAPPVAPVAPVAPPPVSAPSAERLAHTA